MVQHVVERAAAEVRVSDANKHKRVKALANALRKSNRFGDLVLAQMALGPGAQVALKCCVALFLLRGKCAADPIHTGVQLLRVSSVDALLKYLRRGRCI